MKLIFATGNQHKLNELKSKIGSKFDLVSMKELGFTDDIPEPFQTLEENAKTKADTIFDIFHESTISDDSGLEIDALDGRPGVYSARYAGEDCTFLDNNIKVLREMQDITNRSARFRTVIHLIYNGAHHQFEGVVQGEITKELTGKDGFGYDPIFKPNGFDHTFAEMTMEEKNKISHRALAVEKLVAFLNEN